MGINQEKKDYFLPIMIKIVVARNWAWLPSGERLFEIFCDEIDGYKLAYPSKFSYLNYFHKDVGDGWRAAKNAKKTS